MQLWDCPYYIDNDICARYEDFCFYISGRDCPYNGYPIKKDKECLECKRFYSGSCDGAWDRKRTEITIENSCSGFLRRDEKTMTKKELHDRILGLLDLDTDEIIEAIYDLARDIENEGE